MKKQIAFLGTGQMGTGIAGCLIDAGHDLRVYNRTTERARPLGARGATIVNSPAEAAAGADVLISMVGDDPASKAMWCGPDGALSVAPKAQALVIECSTLSHDWVMDLSEQTHSAGYDYLDCPVTGLPSAAAAGQLVLFLGGSQSVINQAQPVLDVFSAKQIHFGDIGSATAYKLIVNLMGSIQLAATAESLLVAEKAGLDLDLVAATLATSASGSPIVERNAALMVVGDHENNVAFSALWRLKDTDYGLKFAEKMGRRSAIGKATVAAFQNVVDAGFSEQAETKIIDLLRKENT